MNDILSMKLSNQLKVETLFLQQQLWWAAGAVVVIIAGIDSYSQFIFASGKILGRESM